MVCSGCPDVSSTIRETAPFANKNDVVDLFNQMVDSCCVSSPIATFLNPASSNSVATTMAGEAFPDGADTCHCPCKYIVDTTNDRVYMNCTQNLNLAENWHDVDEACLGVLTTVGLDPSVDAIGSMAEAFPLGSSVHCEDVLLVSEDGSICWSSDGGVTFQCQLVGTTAEYGLLHWEEASGVIGFNGSATSWNTIPLNTITQNENTNVTSLAASVFVLRAGIYEIELGVTCWRVNLSRARLYNVTTASTIREGINHYSGSATGANVGTSSLSMLNMKYTSNGTDSLRLDLYTQGGGRIGQSTAIGSGANERYAYLRLIRVGE